MSESLDRSPVNIAKGIAAALPYISMYEENSDPAHKIQAIKAFRATTGWSLSATRTYIEHFITSAGEVPPPKPTFNEAWIDLYRLTRTYTTDSLKIILNMENPADTHDLAANLTTKLDDIITVLNKLRDI